MHPLLVKYPILARYGREWSNRFVIWMFHRHEVARFEGLVLCDLRRSEHFRETLLAALCLLRDSDARRFARLQRHITYISNQILSGASAEYNHEQRACYVHFSELKEDSDPEYSAGWWARTLVHEATHGAVESRGVRYTPELRSRIERLCVTEEQRFVLRLTLTHPDLASELDREFDESEWHESWALTPLQRFLDVSRRCFRSE